MQEFYEKQVDGDSLGLKICCKRIECNKVKENLMLSNLHVKRISSGITLE